MNNLVEAEGFCPFIGRILLIKQVVESTNSTVMLSDGMYVDRSEPTGNMPVPLHLQAGHTKRYDRTDVD